MEDVNREATLSSSTPTQGLHIGVFRTDCGLYSEGIIRTMDGHCRLFYIRALNSAAKYGSIQGAREWKTVEIGSRKNERSALHAPKKWQVRGLIKSDAGLYDT